MDNWGHEGMRFDIHTCEGWSMYFRYRQEHCDEPTEMAFKVQPVGAHKDMVTLWDMHCLSGSLEEFIDKYITCSLPDENEYAELNGLVKSVQTHHHTSTCRKKKGVTCRFNAPWPPSEKTHIVRGGDANEVKLKARKLLIKFLTKLPTH